MTRAIFIPDDYRLPCLLGARVGLVSDGTARWVFPTDDPAIVAKALAGQGLVVRLDRDDDTSPGRPVR